LYLICFLS